MEAQLHDGRILEFPDGTDPSVVQATVKKVLGLSTQSKDIQQIDTNLTPEEKIATQIDKVVTPVSDYIKRGISSLGGIAAPVVNELLPNRQNIVDFSAGASSLMRGGANLLDNNLGQTIWPTSAANPESAMRTAGTVADPVSLAIAGGVGKAIPLVPVSGNGFLQGIKAAGQNALSGAVTGGTIGGLSENGTAKEGAVMGATLATALPVLVASGKYIGKRVGEIADLITPGGAKKIADRYVNVIVGKNNKDVLANALKSSKELVAGSKPTAAEAVSGIPAGSPIQAHQKLVSQEPGGISAVFGQRIADQQAARDAALSFAGTPEDVQNLIQQRTAAVKPLYDAVEKSTAQVKSIPVLHKVDSFLKTNPNRDSIAVPMQKIRSALVVPTQTGTKLESNPQALKSLSDQIGDMLGKKTVTGQPEYDVKALRDVKEVLDAQLSKYVPEFKKAQAVFTEMSKPINVMQIGQSLKDKLVNPTGSETPGTYLRALENEKKLLKESIGFGRKGIESFLSPEQMNNVNSVAKDLERTISSKHPLQGTNLRGGINVAGENTISLPNLLSRPAMLANYVIKSVGRNIEPEIDSYLARLYQNPKELASVISQVPAQQRNQFANAVKVYGRAALMNATMNQGK